MSVYSYPITVTFQHELRFTHNIFALDNVCLGQLFIGSEAGAKVLVIVDEAVNESWPQLELKAQLYFEGNCPYMNYQGLLSIPGGEECKNDKSILDKLLIALEKSGLDRHSYVMVIGGGAVLDVVGYATAITHRGIRLLRLPTTVLAQADSGVGVKNSVNAFGQKNFLGTFAVPYAVVNDFDFLESQPLTERREGLVEAIKVALVKDPHFFETISNKRDALYTWNNEAVESVIQRSAVLHAEHIAFGGDPFEMGSSRPLDFGHWAAHKLEIMSGFTLTHGQAVSLGLSLDIIYSVLSGWMEAEEGMSVLDLLDFFKMPTWSDHLIERSCTGRLVLWDGIEEFRSHLGGKLTVLMLRGIGDSFDVHEIREDIVEESLLFLAQRQEEMQNGLLNG